MFLHYSYEPIEEEPTRGTSFKGLARCGFVEEDEEVRLKKTSLYTCSLVEYRSKTASKVYSFAFFVELTGTGFEIRTVLRSARVSKYTLLLLLLLLFGNPSRDDDDDDDAVVVVPDFDEVVVVFFVFFVFFFFFFFSSSSSSSL